MGTDQNHFFMVRIYEFHVSEMYSDCCQSSSYIRNKWDYTKLALPCQ